MSDAMKPILVIGSLNMDLVARCERLPAKGQTVFGQDFFTAPGGKGANQAVAAAKLGARVTMAGCVGTDAFGAALTAGLRAEGIGTDTVVPVVGPTGTALITIDAEGQHHRGDLRRKRGVRRDPGRSCLGERRGPGVSREWGDDATRGTIGRVDSRLGEHGCDGCCG
jgi:bifunctional ADP-heptose synthase (sugar kinase/adenylyltransferase)